MTHHQADAWVGGSGSGQIEVRPVKAEIAIAASAVQHQPPATAPGRGQHHGHRRSPHRVVCQRQQLDFFCYLLLRLSAEADPVGGYPDAWLEPHRERSGPPPRLAVEGRSSGPLAASGRTPAWGGSVQRSGEAAVGNGAGWTLSCVMLAGEAILAGGATAAAPPPTPTPAPSSTTSRRPDEERDTCSRVPPAQS